MKAINILWDTEDTGMDAGQLPEEIEIPQDIADKGDDAVSDYITELTGFCHMGFATA